MSYLRELIDQWLHPSIEPSRVLNVRIPRSLMQQLHRITQPTETLPEPLALAVVRYASEDSPDIIVVSDIIAFADSAYVEGPAGANFDTRWLLNVVNNLAPLNAGILLVHNHGGRGKPSFSRTDQETNREVIGAIAWGMPTIPYGAMVMSSDNRTAIIAHTLGFKDASVSIGSDRLGRLDCSA